jgi:phenylacetate-CoA ligase
MTNSFYLLLPRKLQDGLLSIYGANIYRQRFHGSLPEAYCNDLTIFGEPTAIENTKQEHRLQALLSHCKHYIPYYKDLLRHIDTSVITTESLKDIVPIMTKSDVLNNYTQLCSTHPGHWGKLRTANTSGSSGTPLEE